MWTSALFGAKNSDFSKFMVCPHGQGGLSQCGRFADKGGRESNFRDFLRTAFYGILWMPFMEVTTVVSTFCIILKNLQNHRSKGVGRKVSRGRGQRKKQDRKIAPLSFPLLYQ